MKNLSAGLTMAALASVMIAAAPNPGIAASKKKQVQQPVQTVPVISGRPYGNWFFSDGSQQWLGRTVAGAAPNIIATGAGVRCEFRYAVSNGQRVKYEYCE